MAFTKRVQRTVLFLIVVTLLTGTWAPAAHAALTAKLTPPPDSPEPGASGQAKVTHVVPFRYDEWGNPWYEGWLTVTCKGLTPNATYDLPPYGCTASPRGTLKTEGRIEFSGTMWIGVANGAGVVVLLGCLGSP